MASALDIMIDGPIGAAVLMNMDGLRSVVISVALKCQRRLRRPASVVRGYHKPVMIAGSIGSVREEHVNALPFPEGTALVVLGGPAMLIGFVGGAASSMASV